MYNAFMSDNPNCKLRQREGYIKSTDVAGTRGKKATSVLLLWLLAMLTSVKSAVSIEQSNAKSMLAVEEEPQRSAIAHHQVLHQIQS